MTRRYRTPEELREAGIDALVAALGPVDTQRFLRGYYGGRSDYTAERLARLGHLTLEELLAQGDELRASGELPMPPEPESRPASA